MSKSVKLAALLAAFIISLGLSGCGPAFSGAAPPDSDQEGDAVELRATASPQNLSDVQIGQGIDSSYGRPDESNRQARSAQILNTNETNILSFNETGDREKDLAAHSERQRDEHVEQPGENETLLPMGDEGHHRRRHLDGDTNGQDQNETQRERDGGLRQGRQDDDEDRPSRVDNWQKRNENQTRTDANRSQRRRQSRQDEDDDRPSRDDDWLEENENQTRPEANRGQRRRQGRQAEEEDRPNRDDDWQERHENQTRPDANRGHRRRQGRQDKDEDRPNRADDWQETNENQTRPDANRGQRRRQGRQAEDEDRPNRDDYWQEGNENQTRPDANRGQRRRQGRQDEDGNHPIRDDDWQESNENQTRLDANRGQRRRHGRQDDDEDRSNRDDDWQGIDENQTRPDANRGRRRRGRHSPMRGPTPAPTPSLVAETVEQASVLLAARAINLVLSQADNRADMLGGIVRLSFHDAATFDPVTNTGGADGCVDLSVPENNGLGLIIDALSSVVSAVEGNLSRADVWALAATMAIEAAGGPEIGFQTGRIDNDSCGGHGERLPNAELGRSHIVDVMVSKLSFSERETAALMGAHVLGKATRSISGYEGVWVRNTGRFSNQYFRDLLARPWNRDDLPEFGGQPRSQWDGPGNTMMLNTDIELAFDTSSGCTRAGGGGGDRLRGQRCPRAAGAFSEAVTEFAQRGGERAFFEAFVPAFKKLISLGAAALTCPFMDCHTPGV